jgi:VIT1/CCC1 family predicted Fe2+/Mn2+ transporter
MISDVERVRRAVVEEPGELSAAVREALVAGQPAPPPFEAYVEKVRRHAYRVTDAEVEALAAATSEDAVFEATVATALGAGLARLEAGLAAIEAAR